MQRKSMIQPTPNLVGRLTMLTSVCGVMVANW
ncbi:hypothetical protein GGP43_003378 [Salinibacter ruber]|nr:hypothetical protein [Salinibacter ruber]